MKGHPPLYYVGQTVVTDYGYGVVDAIYPEEEGKEILYAVYVASVRGTVTIPEDELDQP